MAICWSPEWQTLLIRRPCSSSTPQQHARGQQQHHPARMSLDTIPGAGSGEGSACAKPGTRLLVDGRHQADDGHAGTHQLPQLPRLVHARRAAAQVGRHAEEAAWGGSQQRDSVALVTICPMQMVKYAEQAERVAATENLKTRVTAPQCWSVVMQSKLSKPPDAGHNGAQLCSCVRTTQAVCGQLRDTVITTHPQMQATPGAPLPSSGSARLDACMHCQHRRFSGFRP